MKLGRKVDQLINSAVYQHALELVVLRQDAHRHTIIRPSKKSQVEKTPPVNGCFLAILATAAKKSKDVRSTWALVYGVLSAEIDVCVLCFAGEKQQVWYRD
ncbi:MAG TPA: hypothetical protein VHV10_01910, partial [Ktedonobacteraceae bacterium]|nr:hypothetical protein [Ktedonobacteraceae bacterium]